MKQLVKKMTLDEKIKLVHGADFWRTHAIERLNIPQMMLSDGPHGLRKQAGESDHLGLNESLPAVCFPAGCAMGATFNIDLMHDMGELLGQYAKQENIHILLGPAMNIKRSPLCGRNFEYLSEDPLLTGELATAYVKGVQSQGVGTSPKHFAVNNQEYRRMTSSSNLSQRTLREIYLPAFEKVVKVAKPYTMMGAYNRINGEYACDHYQLLTQILRDEWGFEGLVVSDWGAVNAIVSNIKAGLDLAMPFSPVFDKQLRSAIEKGDLDEEILDRACERILSIIEKTAVASPREPLSLEEGHAKAREFAQEAIVLLKNEAVLPLNPKSKLAYIGPFAQSPRFQGGGSSHINSYRVVSAMEASRTMGEYQFAEGFTLGDEGIDDERLLREAVEIANSSEVVVVFIGLPDAEESEGYDRTHLRLPQQQVKLLDALSETSAKIIAILHNGAPVEMPWLDKVDGLLEVYLAGEAVGEAITDLLFGAVSPSGRLAETIPLRLEDTATYLTYGKDKDEVEYHEGIFVGYRYYTSKNLAVQFPFGFGLSYTSFSYKNLRLSSQSITDQETVDISVEVTNTGDVVGKEVIQLYVSSDKSQLIRAKRELKAFKKVELQPGETKTVVFTLDSRAFAYWSEGERDWICETGNYHIQIASDAQTVLLAQTLHLTSTATVKEVFTVDSTVGDILANPRAAQVFGELMGQGSEQEDIASSSAVSQEMIAAMMASLPLRAFMSYVPDLDEEKLNGLVYMLNQSQI